MRLDILLACILGLGLAAPSVSSEEAITDTLSTLEDCLQCHAPGSDLTKHNIPSDKLYDPEKKLDYRIDPIRFAGSNHGKLACRICHIVGKEVYPHLEGAKEQYFDCGYCHERQTDEQKYDVERIIADFEKSVHYAKHADRFSCYSCHDPHVFDLTGSEKAIAQVVRDDNDVCLECHADPIDFEELTDPEFPVIRKSHSWLPQTELHWGAVRCIECHTPHTEIFTHEILSGDRAEKNCVACHSTDSILLTTLYKYRAREERSRVGFVNAAIFGEAYVIGVTRNAVLDRWSVIILIVLVAALSAHGLLRAIFARWRARR